MELKITNKKGKQFIILYDESDSEKINKHKWHVQTGKFTYARTSIKNGKLLMHRYLMDAEKFNCIVDHKNHNTLDNRKSNLRLCTFSQNLKNKVSTGSSKYLGVFWDNERSKWVASIKNNNKIIRLGRYDDEELAARIYDAAAKMYHGEFANLNFKQ